MTTPPSSFSTTTNPQEAFPLSLSYDTLESSIVHKLNTIQRNVDVIQSRLKLLGTIQDTHVLKSKLYGTTLL
ncbi:hypothetical protein HMI56_005707 [Coelomomyces lativittatus]|nr:hypothetical protein HMI56_005707 [Coelomomyces lativittatus]